MDRTEEMETEDRAESCGMTFYQLQLDRPGWILPENQIEYIWDLHTGVMTVYVYPDRWVPVGTEGSCYFGMKLSPEYERPLREDEIRSWGKHLCELPDYEQRVRYCMEHRKEIDLRPVHPVLRNMCRKAVRTQGRAAVEGLLQDTDYSQRQLERLCREAYGYSPKRFCRNQRMLQAVYYLLRNTEKSMAAVVVELGYADASHFQREFRTMSGMTPGQMIKRYR